MRKAVVCAVVLLAATLLCPAGARAQTDWTKYEAQATELLQQYFRLDTSNPPGNERRAAEFFCALFAKEGIECQIFDIAPLRISAENGGTLHSLGSAFTTSVWFNRISGRLDPSPRNRA